MEIVQIAELIGSAVVGGWVSRLLTIKSRVRQEGAQATKAESEAKKEQIEIIQKLVDDIYKPTIEDLKQDVRDLRVEVREVREENAKLKEENTQLRAAIREISPDLLPSKRGAYASSQRRGKNGQFVKKENADEAEG